MRGAPIRGSKPRRIFDGLANARGPLLPEAKVRLRAVIENPTSETWERAAWLVLHPTGITLWNAVCVVDPTFPTVAPPRHQPWQRVPDQLTIVRSIRAATSGRITREQVAASSLERR